MKCKEKGLIPIEHLKDGVDYQKLITAAGPEDMVLDLTANSKPRIIISCHKFKGLKSYEGKLCYYDLTGETADATSEFQVVGVDKLRFRPHGIFLRETDSEPYLYVISHEPVSPDSKKKEHIIYKFRIEGDKLTSIRKWDKHNTPTLTLPNDLYVAENEEIYFSNHGSLSQILFRRKKGYIGQVGQSKPITEKLIYPNGIIIYNGKLFTTDTRSNELLSFDVDQSGTVNKNKNVCGRITGGDNINLSNNKLVIANHPNGLKFFLHALTRSSKYFRVKSPSSVYEVNTQSDPISCQQIFYSDGTVISGSSSALIYKDDLFVSQVLGNFILKVADYRKYLN